MDAQTKQDLITMLLLMKKAREQEEAAAAFARVSERAGKALDVLDRIEKAEQDILQKEAEEKKAGKALQKAQETMESVERKEALLREEAESLKDTDKELALFVVKEQNGSSLLAELSEVKAREKEVSAQKKKAEKAAADYTAARDAYNQKRTEYLDIQNAFLDAQAGFLARTLLRDGEPCPVCGSRNHPHPCALAEEHRELTREMVENLSSEAAALQKDQEKKAGLSGSAADLLAEKTANYVRAAQTVVSKISTVHHSNWTGNCRRANAKTMKPLSTSSNSTKVLQMAEPTDVSQAS